jgi:hypothetical protein
VCRIGPDGCSADNCFCQHPPHYWSYWQLRNGSWVYSPMGSAAQSVSAGGVEGWRWGTGDPPPAIAFEAICSPPPTEPPPTAVPVPPTATPVPPTAVPPPPTVIPPTEVVVLQATSSRTTSPSTVTSTPAVLSSPTIERTTAPSPSPSATASSTATYTPTITPSTTSIPVEGEQLDNDMLDDRFQPEVDQGSSGSEIDQEGRSGGLPVQYLYFGIISVLMGAILVVFNIYQRKQ